MLKRFESITLSEEDAVGFIEKMSPEEFLQMGVKSFQLYMGDQEVMKIWRIISIERFRNDRANTFFIEEIIDKPISYQAAIFDGMMKKGLIRECDPVVLAREFYSYMIFIYFRYFEVSSSDNPVDNPEIQKLIEEHMQFMAHAMQK